CRHTQQPVSDYCLLSGGTILLLNGTYCLLARSMPTMYEPVAPILRLGLKVTGGKTPVLKFCRCSSACTSVARFNCRPLALTASTNIFAPAYATAWKAALRN